MRPRAVIPLVLCALLPLAGGVPGVGMARAASSSRLAAAAPPAAAGGALEAPSPPRRLVVEVRARENSTSFSLLDTGLKLKTGDVIALSASGSWSHGPDEEVGPEGVSGTERNGAPLGALVARVGLSGHQLYVGARHTFISYTIGNLYLGFNDGDFKNNRGGVTVTVRVNPPTAP